jgi:hypothetical protein
MPVGVVPILTFTLEISYEAITLTVVSVVPDGQSIPES